MAKKAMVKKNEKRIAMAAKQQSKRAELKAIIHNRELPLDDRMRAQRKLSSLPANGARNRIRNRCELTGRPRGYYRYFKLSRIMLRSLGGFGLIIGLTKSSW